VRGSKPHSALIYVKKETKTEKLNFESSKIGRECKVCYRTVNPDATMPGTLGFIEMDTTGLESSH
jgi:hypothetical protein